ncbi:FabD/lysophospholipase-like protein [Periconia macrospinosa]|uniref:FabD/lysophospholipase-like protein n=1 Tax=Periconia macrospinosa TaxID=97972 RepID=A0A2V1DBL2_9PLEO|nr:FabD/lysophospholipase-like protein [Periconia macrospinosa]
MNNEYPWVTFADSSPGGRTLSLNKHSEQIKNAKDAYPSLITMIGRRTKATILEHTLGITSIAVQQQVYLRASPKLTHNRCSVLVADCDASYRKLPQTIISRRSSSTSWNIPTTDNATATFSSRILAPFSGVIVYFVADLGGPKAVAQRLAYQASLPPPSNLGLAPLILLVVETSSDTFDESIAANRYVNQISDVLKRLQGTGDELGAHKAINQHFKQLTVIGLRSFMNNEMRAKVFKKRMIGLLELASDYRRQSCLQFSLQHFYSLTKYAINNLSQDGFTTMCFAKTSRPRGFSTEFFRLCLKDLLGQMPSLAWMWHVVVPLVASALYLASYPPGSHRFSPEYLFTQLYHDLCEKAISEYTEDVDIQRRFVFTVLTELRNIFIDPDQTLSAADAHRRNLQKIQTHLTRFKSHRSCFCCLMRMPEKAMVCGHTFCDACIKIYGRRSHSEKHTFELSECMLCGVSYVNSTFRLVPPTAGIRVLTLDGGGVRGTVPLVFLQHIEHLLMKFDCPARDYFDYVCGTSAGGLVTIGLFLLQWDAAEAMKQLEDVAEKTFSERDRGSTVFEKALKIMLAYIEDGKYSLSAIQDAFKASFGSEIKMFNPLRNDTKVAVTTTTVKESTPALFTNYNGGKRSSESGYDVLRAERPVDDISLSEAACCTSAAPWFFKPQHVRLGTFQDGGLHHNCPSEIADWEIKFLWPEKSVPDYALSLGTGTAAYTTSTAPHRKTYRFITRLWQNFMRSLDSEEAWKRFYNNLPASTRHRYHRLNLRFSNLEPRLDDVSSIKQLKSQTAEAVCSSYNNIGPIIDTMKASMFYFELDGLPRELDGLPRELDGLPQAREMRYEVSGFILCRLDLSLKGRQHLYENLLDTGSWFVVQGELTRCVESIPKGYPPFKCRIRFTVGSDEEILMLIRGMTESSSLISGFPTTVNKLINHQQLDSPFGTIDHMRAEKSLPETPQKRAADSLPMERKRHRGTFF